MKEERNTEIRQRKENERMAAISQQALERQQEKQDQIDQALLQKEQHMQLLQQRRENERIARDNMTMTVDLASHNGILDIDLNE